MSSRGVCKSTPSHGDDRLASGTCRLCNRERVRRNAEASPERVRAAIAKCRADLKKEVMARYGGPECALCGFYHPDAMVLDHSEGGGGNLRKSGAHPWGGDALYRWLKKNSYPPELKFRVLCFNCNAIESVKLLREVRSDARRK